MMRRWMEKWGWGIGACLCALTIAFAAVYTRQDDLKRLTSQSAVTNEGQTLDEATAQAVFTAPVDSGVMKGFEGAHRSDQSTLWRMNPCTYYTAARGQRVCAVTQGTVADITDNEITITHTDGYESHYRDLLSIIVEVGDTVQTGQKIATAGNCGYVRVTLAQDGAYLDLETILSK